MRPRMGNNFRLSVVVTMVLCVGVAWAWSMPLTVNIVTLRAHLDTGAMTGVPISVGQVAQVEGPDAQAITSVAIRPSAGQVRQSEVSHALTQAGFHRGMVVVKGHMICRLDTSARPTVNDRQTMVSWRSQKNSSETVASSTLREMVTAFVAPFAKAPSEDLRLRYAASDASWLGQPVAGRRLEIEPLSTTGLGRVPLIIRQYQGDQLLESRRVTVDVSRRYQALTLTRPLSKGAVITSQDVEIREVYHHGPGEPLTHLSQAVGLAVRGLLREGAVLLAEHLEPAAVIRRGQLITVRSLAGNLSVTTTARALENGAAGDRIPVRHETSRQTYTARITSDGHAVLISEEDPSAGLENSR